MMQRNGLLRRSAVPAAFDGKEIQIHGKVEVTKPCEAPELEAVEFMINTRRVNRGTLNVQKNVSTVRSI
jgi:hypothetical protein